VWTPVTGPVVGAPQSRTVLGPQFGGQAPGTSEEERAYAYRKFGTESFDVFDKIDVNGPDAHPLYKFLRTAQPLSYPGGTNGGKEGRIEWNYSEWRSDSDGVRDDGWGGGDLAREDVGCWRHHYAVSSYNAT